MGADSSAVATSHDYFLKHASGEYRTHTHDGSSDDGTRLVQNDAWIDANESWAYASANTITIPAGGATKFAVGDRIKWTQTTVKYGVIITVADELLTIAINTDYVVTDAAITLNYYSHQASPIGFPGYFNYTPTYGGTGSMTYTSVTAQATYFSIVGRMCTVVIARASGTTGGTASTSLTFTLPVATDHTSIMGGAFCYDGAAEAGMIEGASTTVINVKKYAGDNWALAATKLFGCNLSYRIA